MRVESIAKIEENEFLKNLHVFPPLNGFLEKMCHRIFFGEKINE